MSSGPASLAVFGAKNSSNVTFGSVVSFTCNTGYWYVGELGWVNIPCHFTLNLLYEVCLQVCYVTLPHVRPVLTSSRTDYKII